jgi:hypothetical protein
LSGDDISTDPRSVQVAEGLLHVRLVSGLGIRFLNILKVPMRNAAKRTPAKNGRYLYYPRHDGSPIDMEFIETINTRQAAANQI